MVPSFRVTPLGARPRAGDGGTVTPRPGRRPRGLRGAARKARGRAKLGGFGWQSWWELNQHRFLLAAERDGFRLSTVGVDDDLGGLTDEGSSAVPPWETLRARVRPVLLGALVDDRPEVRATAALALGRAGSSTQSVSAVTKLLSDASPLVCETACVALGMLGADGVLIDVLERSDRARKTHGDGVARTSARIAAAIGLGLSEGYGTPSLFRVAMDSGEHVDVRVAAVLALGVRRDGRVAGSQLRVLVTDQEAPPSVRMHAAVALGRQGASGARSMIMAMVDSDAPRVVRHGCIVALGLLGSPDAGTLEVLIRQAKEAKDRRARDLAILALGESGSRSAMPTLTQLLHKGQTIDRDLAALALALIARQHKEVAGEINGALSRSLKTARAVDQRAAIAIALGLTASKSAAPALRRALRSGMGSGAARGLIALAAALVGDRESVGALERLLRRGTSVQKRSAALGLVLLRAPGIEGRLRKLMVSPRSADLDRAGAALALGRLPSDEGVDVLLPLAANEGGRVRLVPRSCALAALGLIAQDPGSRTYYGYRHHLVPGTLSSALLRVLMLL